jgi:hypothetical protein
MKRNLKRFVTWRTDNINALTYEEAVSDAAARLKGGKVYILEIEGVAKPVLPPVEIIPYKEGM